ncbi:hypothetical protein ACWER6_18360 [Streptomyces sp. NPDC004009]
MDNASGTELASLLHQRASAARARGVREVAMPPAGSGTWRRRS